MSKFNLGITLAGGFLNVLDFVADDLVTGKVFGITSKDTYDVSDDEEKTEEVVEEITTDDEDTNEEEEKIDEKYVIKNIPLDLSGQGPQKTEDDNLGDALLGMMFGGDINMEALIKARYHHNNDINITVDEEVENIVEEEEDEKIDEKYVIKNIPLDLSGQGPQPEPEEVKYGINLDNILPINKNNKASKDAKKKSTVSQSTSLSPSKVITVVDQDEAINKNFLNNVELNEIVKSYNYAQKILAGAILWLCDKVSDNQLDALIRASVTTNEDLQKQYGFVNSITNYFGNKLFIPNNVEPNAFDFDTNQLKAVMVDLSYKDKLIGTNFPSIFEKANQFHVSKTGGVIVAFGQAKTPIFTQSGMEGVKNEAEENYVNRVEGFIGDILTPYKHWVIPNPQIPWFMSVIIQADNGLQRVLDIEPGLQFGEYKAVLPDEGNAIYLTSNKELIKKYIETGAPLTHDEIRDIVINEHQFIDSTLYSNIAVCQAQPIINKMSRKSINTLERKLKFVNELIMHGNQGRVPLLRIRNLKNENSFILVSDEKAKCPGTNCNLPVADGFVVRVNKGNFVITIVDSVGNLIDKGEYNFDESFIEQINDFDFEVIKMANEVKSDLKAFDEADSKK